MDLEYCYRLLELSSQASSAEIKESYRRLARQYHPDVNPNNQQAKDKFIALTQAYKLLVSVVPPVQTSEKPSKPEQTRREYTGTVQRKPAPTKITRKQTPIPPLSASEERLKWKTEQQLQQLLKYQRFPKAIALVEALAQRLPQDSQVRQWQASVYQSWGRKLLNEKQLDKARIYLKKALKTDPHNRSLWSEVERDFRRMEKIF